MDHKQNQLDDHEDRIVAYAQSYENAEEIILAIVQPNPAKYGLMGKQAIENSMNKIQAWEIDRLLGKSYEPGTSTRAIAAGALNSRDNMQVRAFHAFYRQYGDMPACEALLTAIVKTCDDEFDKIWDHSDRRRAFRKWLATTRHHSFAKTYDFEKD